MGKALDDRALVLVQIGAMKRLAETGDDIPDLYFALTTQEEVGCRGVRAAAYTINPDSAVALDITITNDIPGILSNKNVVELDKRPAIKLMDRLATSHMRMISAPSIVVRRTPRPSIWSGEECYRGDPAPTRYVHAREVISGKDMAAMIRLLVHYLRSLGD